MIIPGGGINGIPDNMDIWATKIVDKTTGELSPQWQKIGVLPIDSFFHAAAIDRDGFLHIVAGMASDYKILNKATYSAQIIC